MGAMVTVGGLVFGKKAVETSRKKDALNAEYRRAQQFYPTILLVYDNNVEAAEELARHFMQKSPDKYGVLIADSKDTARAMLQNATVSAVLSPYGRGDGRALTETEARQPNGSVAPRIKTGNRTPDALEETIKRLLERRTDPAKDQRMQIAGFFEDTRNRECFRRELDVPNEISLYLADLVSRGHSILQFMDLDSHRGGGFAVSYSGTPIDKKSSYAHPGLFMKLDSSKFLPRYREDDLYYNQSQKQGMPRFAQPYVAVPYNELKNILVMEYFHGPMSAYVLRTMSGFRDSQGISQTERVIADEIIHRTLFALLRINADYVRRHQERSRITPERVDTSISHYQAAIMAAYHTLQPLFDAARLSEAEFKSVMMLEGNRLRNPAYWGTIMDLSLHNSKFRRMGIEEPELEELIDFYKNGSGRVMSIDRIAEEFGIYDIGYTTPQDRHMIDAFGRAAFSAYLGSDIKRRFRYLEDWADSKMSVESGRTSPLEFAEHFAIFTSLRYLRFVEDSVSALMEIERLLAVGERKPSEHMQKKRLYMDNTITYLNNWEDLLLASAYYFEKNPTPRNQRQFITDLQHSFEKAHSSANHPLPAEGIAGRFARLYQAVHEMKQALPEISERMLLDARKEIPYRVMFSALAA